MKAARMLLATCTATALGLGFGIGVVVGENQAPDQPVDVAVGQATTLDLGPELDTIDGRQLRVRVITFEPGGAVPLHSHAGRPGIAYILQGTLTEHVDGKGVVEHPQGDRIVEDHTTVHWAENRTSGRVVVLSTDVFKP